MLCPAVRYEVQEFDEAKNLPMVACMVFQFLFILIQRLHSLHEADTFIDSDADIERPKQGRERRKAQVQGVYAAQIETVKEQLGAALP